ncbi:MAG: hypothetical protein AABO57_08200 [Acidobacteriota bacterium]
MMFLLLNLLQPQQPRLSRAVIVGAVLVFIVGVSLLVYFFRRYKRMEKEPEEDWDMSRRSLFVNVAPPVQQAEEPVGAVTAEVGVPVPEASSIQTGGTRELATEVELPPSAHSTTAEAELQVETSPSQEPIQPAPPVEPSPEPRPTELLASPSPKEPAAETEVEPEPAAFDDEVWAGLEVAEQPIIAQEESATPTPLPPAPELLRDARVDERSHREPFEPPRIERIMHREPYEPPRIEPLTPREQAAATRELRSARPPQVEEPSGDFGQKRPAATGLFGSLSSASGAAAPAEPARVDSGTRELAAESIRATSVRVPQPSVPSIAGAYAHKPPAGSVLGLPAERSQQPLIFGDPVRDSRDAGIGALSNYGKDVGPRGGRTGTIALLAVVVLLGGAVLLYLFVPSVHSRVGAYVANLRGTDTQAAREAAMKQRAQIIPSYRPEVNKNMVTARGAVDNISDEPLENLSIEVSLQRGADTPPEIRNVSVVPNPLPPGQRGTFEFEYDGKRDTGFTGYKITRLLSNGTEVKFRMPGQK